jgi:hypothetical protein
MPITYDNIATTTLGTAASTITFNSIPATYTDLRLTLVITGMSAGNRTGIQFNGDTASNYSTTRLQGDGATASSTASNTNPNIRITDVNQASTSLQFITLDVFSYAGSTNKIALATLSNDANGSGSVYRSVGLYRSTTAISSLNIMLLSAGTMSAGTTATLYGIKNA